MFKFKAPSKKKKRKLVPASTRDDESSDEEERGNLKKKTLDKNDDDNDGADDDDNVEGNDNTNIGKTKKSSTMKDKKKRRKKKREMNSYGAVSFTNHDDEEEEENENDDLEVTYGKDSKRSMKKDKKDKKDKKKKKKIKLSHSTKGGLGFGGANMLSHLNDGDDHDEEGDKGTKRFNRFGMGKLGTSIIHDDDDDYQNGQNFDNTQDDAENNSITNNSSSLYGKEALAKLKASQRKMKQPPTEKNDEESKKNSSLDDNIPPLPPKPSSAQKPKPPTDNQDSEDFIPLDSSCKVNQDSSANLNIVTGDEALMYTGELDDDDDGDGINKANLGTETLSNVQDETKSKSTTQDVLAGVGSGGDNTTDRESQDVEMDEGGRKWEEEIARRAGVSTNDRQGNVRSSSENRSQPISTESGSAVIKEVKSTIRSTLKNLTQMDLDLESNIGRRGHDEQMSNEDATKKEKELDDVGKKFEYYQNLRVKLADWIGALRYVSERVTMVENAVSNLNHEFSAKDERVWREWEDDVISTLKERDLLDYVVGRQPEVEAENDENNVDEFGRDKSSLKSLARTKREMQRRRIRRESKDRRQARLESVPNEQNTMKKGIEFDDSDLDLSDNELMDREDRRSAVSDAVGVVMEEMDDDYSSPSKLISAFYNWHSQYLDDFDQCYAKIAFVELMNVFIRSESCQKIDLLCFTKKEDCIYSNFDSFSWFKALRETHQLGQDDKGANAEDNNEKGKGNTSFAKANEVIIKVSDPLLSILKGNEKGFGSFNPYSAKQTKTQVTFLGTIKAHLTNEDSTQLEKISESIFQHINNFVQNQAFPVIKQTQVVSELDDILTFAAIGQLYRLKKLLCNLLQWYDVLEGGKTKTNLAKFCLMDLVAYRLLPILNSIEGNFENQFDSKCFLKEVGDLMQVKGFLQNKDLTLSSAPFRVAMSKIQ